MDAGSAAQLRLRHGAAQLHRLRDAAAMAIAAALLVLNVANALAAEDFVSVSIVDAPRVQTKWGYAPTARTIASGTWVTWSNDGTDAHTVTALDGSFDSGNLDPSQGFSWYFDQPGTFEYVCVLHPWMKGRIVVGDGVPATTTDTPEEELPDDAAGGD